MINTLIFLWLQNQTFYNKLQLEVIENINIATSHKSWADIGCSTGLLTRIAKKLNYNVSGFDLSFTSLLVAKILSFNLKNIKYFQKDFFTLDTKYDIITATSLLSVVKNKKEALVKLLSLLKDDNSTLIIIEPTSKLTIANSKKLITNLKTFWYYKGLLVWANARQNKAIDFNIFKSVNGISIIKKYYLDGMICIIYIKKGKL